MDDVVFVSVAFGERYIEQQIRLRESILSIYPEANILFFTTELPEGSKSFYDSLYGFKPYAILQAISTMKCNKVVWCDPAMILMDKIDDLMKYSVVAVQDDNLLCNYISERYLSVNNMSRQHVYDLKWHLVGGSLYYIDFTTEQGQAVFSGWINDESKGLFGSQYEEATEQLQGHRADETCMAMNLYLNDIKPTPGPDVRYCIEKNPMFIKKHFK